MLSGMFNSFTLIADATIFRLKTAICSALSIYLVSFDFLLRFIGQIAFVCLFFFFFKGLLCLDHAKVSNPEYLSFKMEN